MRKSINSATQKFEDQITEELVLDAAPTVNSFNGVTSDGVARAIAGASGEVPQVTEGDNGKVLKAIYDEGGPAVEWAEQTIPAVDQTYDATSANAQSGTAVAGAIAGVNQVPASTSGDSGKVLTVNSQGAAEWDTPAAPAASGGGWVPGDESPLWSYPDGSYGDLCEDTRGHTLAVGATNYDYLNKFFVYNLGTNLITVYEPPMYKGYHTNFSLTFGKNISPSGSSTGIPSGYKAAWCQDTAKTRYYIVESGATLPTSYNIADATIRYAMQGGPGSVTYDHSLSLVIPQPPSVHPDYTPNPSKYTKVGDWSSLTSDIHQWYLGFVKPSTGEWLTLPNILVGTTQYIQGGAQTRQALTVTRPLPASTSADENKVLTVNAFGSPVWSTPSLGSVQSIQLVNTLPADPDSNTLYLIPEA